MPRAIAPTEQVGRLSGSVGGESPAAKRASELFGKTGAPSALEITLVISTSVSGSLSSRIRWTDNR